MKTATPGFAEAGFSSVEIYLFNPDVLPDMTFVPISVSELTLHRNVNREQGTAAGSKCQERRTIHKEATVTRWTSLGHSV
jgi:hypothetical protein